jgi:hypothetical protein
MVGSALGSGAPGWRHHREIVDAGQFDSVKPGQHCAAAFEAGANTLRNAARPRSFVRIVIVPPHSPKQTLATSAQIFARQPLFFLVARIVHPQGNHLHGAAPPETHRFGAAPRS